jgi:hypothetical protein
MVPIEEQGIRAGSMDSAAMLLVLAIAGALLAGCHAKGPVQHIVSTAFTPHQGTPSQVTVFDKEADEIDSRLRQMKRVDGEWMTGDVATRYSAYFDGGQLMHIDADRTSGELAATKVEIYFDGDEPFRYAERGYQEVRGRSRSGEPIETDSIELLFVFDRSGKPVNALKWINMIPAEPSQTEIADARSYADSLRALAARQK